jgi:hypothetical protein
MESFPSFLWSTHCMLCCAAMGAIRVQGNVRRTYVCAWVLIYPLIDSESRADRNFWIGLHAFGSSQNPPTPVWWKNQAHQLGIVGRFFSRATTFPFSKTISSASLPLSGHGLFRPYPAPLSRLIAALPCPTRDGRRFSGTSALTDSTGSSGMFCIFPLLRTDHTDVFLAVLLAFELRLLKKRGT